MESAGAPVIGLMSGTSLDGVDAVLVDFSGPSPRTLATFWLPYPDDIRRRALDLQAAGPDEIHRSALLANALAGCYAEAVRQLLAGAAVDADCVAAIGCHGQTIRHQPGAGYTVQLNNPALLAELTGIAVVADFRSRDIAAGGQGAPLVPAFHAAVFGDPLRHRVILNIGGIANLTDLAPGRPVRGFDCGPGNLLLDAWVERHQGRRYDEGGHWAAQGKVLPQLLQRLLEDPFFAASPPKSCGRDEFNTAWLDNRLAGSERPEDVQSTLLELTAVSVAEAMGRWCGKPQEVFVCGGGARNQALMARLQEHLPDRRVASTDFLDQPADWVEAVAFAWLAWRTLRGVPGNLTEVTGACGPRILGAIYPR
jgi:anhydro-N-acetylmuramic acid kinase